MRTKFYAEAHIPRGSGDAEYRIVKDGVVIAIVDPDMQLSDPAEVAEKIAAALNAHEEEIV